MEPETKKRLKIAAIVGMILTIIIVSIVLIIYFCVIAKDKNDPMDAKLDSHQRFWRNFRIKDEFSFTREQWDDEILVMYKDSVYYDELRNVDPNLMVKNFEDFKYKQKFTFHGVEYTGVFFIIGLGLELENFEEPFIIFKYDLDHIRNIRKKYSFHFDYKFKEFLFGNYQMHCIVKSVKDPNSYFFLQTVGKSSHKITALMHIEALLRGMKYYEQQHIYLCGYDLTKFKVSLYGNDALVSIDRVGYDKEYCFEIKNWDDLKNHPKQIEKENTMFWGNSISSWEEYLYGLSNIFRARALLEFNCKYDFKKFDPKEDKFYRETSLKIVKLFLALREKDAAKKIKSVAEIFSILEKEIEDEERKELEQYWTLELGHD